MLRYRPAPPLSAFIDQFWYARGYQPDRKRQSALPTGSVCIRSGSCIQPSALPYAA